ncbi:MAG: hypothetical protein OXN27_11855 [Candidatus Poribacteria bacterium]|nr:hypothetical protein [Candidatus Poribacteria bacterium]
MKRKVELTPAEHSEMGKRLKCMKNTLAEMDIPQHYRVDSKVRKRWNATIQAIQDLQRELDTDAFRNNPEEYRQDWYYGEGSVDYGDNR